jgi:hypothetical protein
MSVAGRSRKTTRPRHIPHFISSMLKVLVVGILHGYCQQHGLDPVSSGGPQMVAEAYGPPGRPVVVDQDG